MKALQLPVYASLFLTFAAAVVDVCTDKIPNRLIAGGFVLCAGLLAAGALPVGIGGCVAGGLLALLLCWIPFRMGALGGGDVKLFLLLGCLNGAASFLSLFFISFLLAAGFSLGKLLGLRALKPSLLQTFRYFQSIATTHTLSLYPERRAKGHTIHFSVAIFGGTILYIGGILCKEIILYWGA